MDLAVKNTIFLLAFFHLAAVQKVINISIDFCRVVGKGKVE